MSKEYQWKKEANKRYDESLKKIGVKVRSIRMSDKDYNALLKYQDKNNYNNVATAITSLIPEEYFKED